MSYNNQRSFGGSPAPRPVLPSAHALNPVTEAMIENKRELKTYAVPGDKAVNSTINVRGVVLSVPHAALMVSHQYAITPDTAGAYPIRKLDSQYADNSYAVVYSGQVKPKWPKDPSFFYVPCYSRYVINKDGCIKNAENGEVVYQNINDEWILELVPDCPVNRLKKVSTFNFKLVAYGKLPPDFTDYGFGYYSHTFDVDAETGEAKWILEPRISVSNNLTSLKSECANINEFMSGYISDFNERKEVRSQIKSLKEGHPVRTKDFTIQMMGITPKEATTPEASAPAQPQAPSASTDFDAELSF